MSSARQLAAILFTDIAGYTAMMQENEPAALAVVRRYLAVLTGTLAEHQGEMVNDYGDGNLCTFPSATEAMRCALELQSKLQAEPKVPLRVGLHIGEIFFEGGKVFGDGVNVASRIQSLGVANSVLFSAEIYSKIANQPEFKTVSLGSFHFKNVSTPMEVFALANEGLVVPERKTMEGKLRSPKSGRRRLVVAVLLVAAILYFLVPWRELIPGMSSLSQKSLLEARIAVLPFENNTNDSTLNVLGEMAADWIVQGLMSLEKIKVVSDESVRENMRSAGVGSAQWTDFAARTGAEKIVLGKIYRQGEKIIFQSQIVDPASGAIEFMIPEISGERNNLEAIVSNLQSRVLTLFVSSGSLEERTIIVNPPRFEAYRLYKKGETEVNFGKARAYFLQALAIDSNFYRPIHQVAFTYLNNARIREADSVVTIIERKYKSLAVLDHLQFEYLKASVRGNGQAIFDAAKALFDVDQKSLYSNYRIAQGATHLNRPVEARNYFSRLDPANVDFSEVSARHWIHWYAFTLIRLGKYAEARKLYQYVPIEKTDVRIAITKSLLYLLLHQADSVVYLEKQFESTNPTAWGLQRFYLAMAERCFTLKVPGQKEWAQKALDNGARLDKSNLDIDQEMIVRSIYYAGNLEEALERCKQLNKSREATAMLGCLYAKLGMKSEAMGIMDDIKASHDNSTYPSEKGNLLYNMACIAAQLGEKEKAVEYLARAFSHGMPFNLRNYEFDYELIPLFDYPPFIEFVKPKG